MMLDIGPMVQSIPVPVVLAREERSFCRLYLYMSTIHIYTYVAVSELRRVAYAGKCQRESATESLGSGRGSALRVFQIILGLEEAGDGKTQTFCPGPL